MADNRDDLSFQVGELQDLGIKSTKQIVANGESFLNGDFDDIVELDESEKQATQKVVKVPAKTTPQTKVAPTKEVKVVTNPNHEITDNDAFDLLEGKVEEDAIQTEKDKGGEEEDEDKDAIVVKKTTPKKEEEAGEEGTIEGKEENEIDIFASVAEEMVKAGIFEAEEGEDGQPIIPEVKSAADLLQHFQDNARRMASETIENYLNSKGDEARAIFDAVIAKGLDPKEYITRYAKVQDFKTLDLTNEGDQERAVRELYRVEGRSSEYIEKKIAQHKANSDLEFEAEEAQRILVKREENNIAVLAQQKAKDDADRAATKQEFVGNIIKILNEKAKAQDFDSIPINNQIAQQTFAYLTEERYKLADTPQLLTEFDKDIMELARPQNHAMKVKIALLLQQLKTDPKLSKLSKKAVSNESSTLFQKLKKNASKGGTSTKEGEQTKEKTKEMADQEPKSWFAK